MIIIITIITIIIIIIIIIIILSYYHHCNYYFHHHYYRYQYHYYYHSFFIFEICDLYDFDFGFISRLPQYFRLKTLLLLLSWSSLFFFYDIQFIMHHKIILEIYNLIAS
jgi:hypothetical protein